ncbi:cation:dicarboxylase symporter family transporter [Paenibacillus sp. GP183]|uniref:dicarboxylate/amino acid:cation symporter n=1 Tax=Paenibacillus sp. GP183 TaxID=1882751 RepID=UPI00089C55D6|nr:cation:dicarboxylase symporter family transporter [Paenibacillus sp. GP183]SEC01207.1 Na+/H+-dicarboxylate symporter [Paenibacillus sp. GP183]
MSNIYEMSEPNPNKLATKQQKRINLRKIPLAYWVIMTLILGFGLGLYLPNNKIVQVIAKSGTYFPKTVVTFATAIIFFLIAAATARLIITYKDKAGKLFSRTFLLYVVLGIVSLFWSSLFILFIIGLPLTTDGAQMPSFATWVLQVADTFKTILAKQPLLQILVAAIVTGWVSASMKQVHVVANGIIRISDGILKVFKWLLWYYPIMIGCLAIYVPMKFGAKGVVYYGKTVIYVAIVSISWALLMMIVTKLITKRSWKQLLSYFWTVYPTGFGTGGSYDTLAVNIISAEKDLQLQPEIAEVSIVFGTVLNKNAATMAVMLCTVTVCWMLQIPISFTEILLLILPLWILGLESPGVPGGAGFFMSPIIAAILQVPDSNLFVTTFVAMYSGLIPMLTTGTNTVDDGFIGAMLEDRFARSLIKEVSSS